jgi:hypothetical protein
MAIFTTYAQFRSGFNPAAPVGADGFKAWSGGDVIAPTGLTVPTTITSWPFSVVATFTLNDPTPGVDRFDWYLSQRTDNGHDVMVVGTVKLVGAMTSPPDHALNPSAPTGAAGLKPDRNCAYVVKIAITNRRALRLGPAPLGQ